MAASTDEVVLRAEQVSKVFAGTVALDKVDFNVYAGKVNVLIGENGAGKSTLMKILAGVQEPTSGKLLLNGQEIQVRNTFDAAKYGIGIIYQELNLFPNLSIAENIFMAREHKKNPFVIDAKKQEQLASQLLERLEHPVDPRTPVGELSLGMQQIVEIAKALAQDVRILIMDEPTSALSNAEVAVLFRIIRELKAQGVAIIYISHKLDELLQIGDYITILRDGKLIEEAPRSQVDVPWIIERMVGRNPASLFKRTEHTIGAELLKVESLSLDRPTGGKLLDDVTLTLRAGEIVGIYGLMGAGRTELFETLAGLRQGSAGQIYFEGKPVKAGTIAERIDMGLVLVPEDRQRAGIVQALSVAQNLTLASLSKYVRRFGLSKKAEGEHISSMIKDMSIKVADPAQPILSLSGGNQQKVVVGKCLLTGPKVLLMDEPTRGIDVAAKSEIFQIMNRLAAQGFGVLFASSELTEVLAMSDRVLVMSKGKITGTFTHEEATEKKLVAASAVGHELERTGGS